MDFDKALATPNTVKLANGEITVKPLTVRQLWELRDAVPGVTPLERLDLSWSQLHNWIANDPRGGFLVLKLGSGLTEEAIEELDTPMRLCKFASMVYLHSIAGQEEPHDDKAEDPKAESQSNTETG